ncbi:hypothetical protein [Sulfitobacter sp.]|jgi:hypothetical protein|uniref:hypothetical protein n=1 Tax=Sulfitobacter sp. TaxID=1903071 RepID=UPI0030012FA5
MPGNQIAGILFHKVGAGRGKPIDTHGMMNSLFGQEALRINSDGTRALGGAREVPECVPTINRFSKEVNPIQFAKDRDICDDPGAPEGSSIKRYHEAANVNRLDATQATRGG